MHANPAPLVLILPRPMREIAARLADRIASKGHGMSMSAAAAVQALLADSDRVELTHLQAAALMAGANAEDARIELAHVQDRPLTARQVLAWQAIGHVQTQLGPQLAPIRMRAARQSSSFPPPRQPEKLNIFPAN